MVRKNKFIIVMFLLLFTSLLAAQEFDRSLYQQTRLRGVGLWNRVITNIEYYKADVVFIEKLKVPQLGEENVDYYFNELINTVDESTPITGSIGLPILKEGQFVTVYFKLLPDKVFDGSHKTQIDHFEIPSESFNFKPTHQIKSTTNVISETYTKKILFTLNFGVEVQALENIENRLYVPILIANGFGGWVESSYLEPIP